MPETAENEALRQEFNSWAEAGKGESMEKEHRPIVEPMLAMMRFAAKETVLDVGCGAGWLVRELASRIPEGRVAGMDLSDEMVERARRASESLKNVEFVTGSVDAIPRPASSFHKVVSVESSYYWPDPAAGLREIFRVLQPGGSAWILINYFRDNPYCHQWERLIPIAMHLLSGDEWAGLFRGAGFREIVHRRIVDPTPAPETYNGRWFRDAAELAAFRKEGALLVHGSKPAESAGPPQLAPRST